jgi:hypothetical protein
MSSTTAYNRLYINGAFVDGTGEETFDVLSPVTGALVSSIPVPSSSDLDAAVRAANDAQPAWAAVNVWSRAEICHRIGDELKSRVGELARLQTLEQGKPLAESIAFNTVNGVLAGGLTTWALPVASPGATNSASMSRGKFQGVMMPQVPTGR